MPTTPPFDALYASWPICPSKAATDAVFTITPRRPSASGSDFAISEASFVKHRNVPMRLMPTTRSHSLRMCGAPSLLIVRTAVPGAGAVDPDAQRRRLGSHRNALGDLLRVGDVGLEELRRAAELLGERLALLRVEVEDRDLCAARRQPAHGGLAEPGRSPADDRCCSLDVHGAAA